MIFFHCRGSARARGRQRSHTSGARGHRKAMVATLIRRWRRTFSGKRYSPPKLMAAAACSSRYYTSEFENVRVW